MSNEKVVGYFKGIIEIESKQDKDQYEKDKKSEISILKSNVKGISQMKKGEDLLIDIDSLDNPLEKRKFDIKLREIDIGDLNISNALTKL